MKLDLYSFGPRGHPLRWDAFLAGFAPLQVTKPDGWGGYWRFELASSSIVFRAPLAGRFKDSITSVNFDDDGVAALASSPEHPFWTGVFKALVSWPAILQLYTGNLGDGIFVPRPELLTQLPPWAQKVGAKFVSVGAGRF